MRESDPCDGLFRVLARMFDDLQRRLGLSSSAPRRNGGAGDLTARAIEQLEGVRRPTGMSPVVVVRPGDATVLFIEPLYWRIRVMLLRLLHNRARMTKAEAFLGRLG